MGETRLRLKPAKGIKVRDPDTRLHIPQDGVDIPAKMDDGQLVPTDKLWRRYLKDGDVVIVTPEDETAVSPDAPAADDAPSQEAQEE